MQFEEIKMKIIKKLCAVAVMSIALSPAVQAADQNVKFTGIVLDSCALIIGTDGLLGQSGDQTILSSTESGGLPGTVTATTNGIASTLEVITPTSFLTGPASADTNTTFASSYALAGTTTLSEVVGSTVSPLGLGVTIATIDASATKSSGTFDSGTYELVTTVRCTVP